MPRLSTLLKLAWPIVVSRMSQVVVGLCDAFMVAHLGETSLAATTTGAMNAFTLFIFPMGVVFIVGSFVSQSFGKGDLQGARRYGVYGLCVAAATVLLSVGSLPFVGSAVDYLPYTPEVRSLLVQYLLLRLPAAGAAVGMEALGNYYGGLGNTRLPMAANLLAMVLNVLGNWLLIDGHLGLPGLGVRGAALASTFATWLAFAFLFGKFLLADGGLRRAIPSGLRVGDFLRMLRFGVPSGANWFLEFLAFAVFINIIVAGLGTTTLAGMMTVLQINSFSFMPAFALASAGAILCGQAIGAGEKDHVPKIAFLTLKTNWAWQGLVGLAYFLLPGLLFAPFAPGAQEGEALRQVGVRLLMLSAGWQLFDATATTMAEILRSAGDTAFTMWARVALAWFLFVPGAYLCTHYLGWRSDGAVFWLTLYLALLAALLAIRFLRGKWREIQLIDGIDAVSPVPPGAPVADTNTPAT